MIAPWRHFSYGSNQQAWCSGCETMICTWIAGWGTEGLPKASRKKIGEHLAACRTPF